MSTSGRTAPRLGVPRAKVSRRVVGRDRLQGLPTNRRLPRRPRQRIGSAQQCRRGVSRRSSHVRLSRPFLGRQTTQPRLQVSPDCDATWNFAPARPLLRQQWFVIHRGHDRIAILRRRPGDSVTPSVSRSHVLRLLSSSSTTSRSPALIARRSRRRSSRNVTPPARTAPITTPISGRTASICRFLSSSASNC